MVFWICAGLEVLAAAGMVITARLSGRTWRVRGPPEEAWPLREVRPSRSWSLEGRALMTVMLLPYVAIWNCAASEASRARRRRLA